MLQVGIAPAIAEDLSALRAASTRAAYMLLAATAVVFIAGIVLLAVQGASRNSQTSLRMLGVQGGSLNTNVCCIAMKEQDRRSF